jgi:uncharacterized linocin/CFP29 family protein
LDLLKRDLAPVLDEAWQLVDEEARRVLELLLAGRRLVDFSGPHGFGLAAVNTGQLDLAEWQPVGEVYAGMRRVQPLLELRTPIRIRQMELDSIGRGVRNPDLRAVAQAAERMARAEDTAIFNGLPEAGITGMLQASPHEPVRVEDVADFPRAIRGAMTTLVRAGINGPYAVALGADSYDEVFAAVEAGYPVVKQIALQVLDAPIVRARVIQGGAVVSMRGGDYELTVGQDLSVGYAAHDREEVELFLSESFTFRVLEPEAAVRLVRA